MSKKRQLLKLWKEVKQLNLPTTAWVQRNSIVTTDENDLGLKPNEQSALNNGKIPSSLYTPSDRINGLIERFEEWLNLRANGQVMVQQLLDKDQNSNYNSITKALVAKRSKRISMDDEEIRKMVGSWQKTISRMHKGLSYTNEELHDLLHEYWYMECRLGMELKTPIFNTESKKDKTPAPEEVAQEINDEIDKEIHRQEKEDSKHAYTEALEQHINLLQEENTQLRREKNRIYETIGRHTVLMMNLEIEEKE